MFYLIKTPDNEFNEFLSSLKELREKTKICSFCFNVFENQDQEKFCNICKDKTRIKDIICIVEKEADLIAIEKTKKHKGLYFVLGGTIPLKKSKKSDIRIKELEQRISKMKNLKEIIIATNFTMEGESTALHIERKVKNINPKIKTSRLRRGMPMGGEIEYADIETLGTSLEERK